MYLYFKAINNKFATLWYGVVDSVAFGYVLKHLLCVSENEKDKTNKLKSFSGLRYRNCLNSQISGF
jgi:hypothetical protein